MHRRIHLLKVKNIENREALRQPGWHADGGGLFLRVSEKGHRSWVYRFTVPGTTKRQEVGLGDLADVSLDQARKERDRVRASAEASRGAVIAPVHKLDRTKTVKVVSEEWLSNGIAKGRWKSLTYPRQLRYQLRDHVYPVIGHQPVATLNREMVRQVLDQQSTEDQRTMWGAYTDDR